MGLLRPPLLLTATFLACTPLLSRAQGAPARSPSTDTVVVAASTGTYPYSYLDSEGRLRGFAVDVFDAVARAMNLKVQRVVGAGRDLQGRFLKGEFNALQSYSYSEEREDRVDFSVPFLTLQGCVFVRRSGAVHALADLTGRRFAVIGEENPADSFLRSNGVRPQVVVVGSAEEALRAVQSGNCAGTYVSRLTALAAIERARLSGLSILAEAGPAYDIQHCFAVHKGDARLLSRLNEGLAIIHHDGEFDQIYHRWFGRIDQPLFSRDQLVAVGLTTLVLALIAALGGFFWQRSLRKRIAGQASELVGQRALLQALYDHIPMAMTLVEIDREGPRVLSINREAGRLYGVAPEKATGQLLAGLPLAEVHRRHLGEVLGRQSRGEPSEGYEYQVEQSRRVLEVTVVPISPDSGGKPRICVLTEDVSTRRLLDAEIAQSRKLRAVGELVGGIAHEFNNLLTPMMLKVSEIQMDWPNDARLQQEIVVIAQATQRAAELTRRLLTFGRKVEPHAEAVHLADQIASCFGLLRPAMDRRIVWESDVPDGLAPLQFNATELNQILINLLLNARDTLLEKLALPHDDDWVPRISVAVAQLPAEAASTGKPRPDVALAGWQRLTVSDNGLGMPLHVVERIFEPFFTTKEVGKGTGLGLATVWHLVTEAGGRVEAESNPGCGTSFHVFLPVWPAPDAPRPSEAANRAPASATANVLLIEDEPLVAQTVISILRRGSHQVRHIADGALAWQHLTENLHGYNVLVVDVNLPGLNGVELVGRVRERNFLGRILIVSGRVAMNDLRALVELQVDRVLTKPFTVPQFETALRECLA